MGEVETPIAVLLPGIRATLASHSRLVLEAPPGAGKTTRVPPALLDCDWLGGQRIVMLEPRRLAARSAAAFMAEQRGEPVGHTVGYRIRFENRVSDATRIEIVTEGIFTRMLQADPGLDGVGAVLFDEFHERHLAADLGLVMARDVQASLRPDLRLVLMSATLDGERMARWFDAPHLTSKGRSFPVQIDHPAPRSRETAMAQLIRLLPQALDEQPGDVLVFLPGQREIMQARRLLEDRRMEGNVLVLPLHGSLPLAEQRAALQPAEPGMRHVVLATNVAESSVTLPGIRTVIDLGLVREPRFDPRSGLTRLETVQISQASADQRAGRAGRVAPGRALRLWPQSRRLEADRRAEIEQADLSSLALELAAWGSGDLQWLTPPPPGALAQARELLAGLGALDDSGRITSLGRRMLETGAAPRLAAAICAAEKRQSGLMADLLALLESRSPLRHATASDDDLRQRLAALHVWRDGGARRARDHGGDAGALAAIDKLARGWRQRLGSRTAPSGSAGPLHVGNLLLPAFPDRVARADPANPLRYRLASGGGAELGEDSALVGEPWLLALELQPGQGDSRIRVAAPFDPDLLERHFSHAFIEHRVQAWNEERQAAEAHVEQRFDQLVLARRPVALTDNDLQAALLAAVRRKGLESLPWNRDAHQLLQRMRCVEANCPQAELPASDDGALLDTLEDWLAPWLAGTRSLAGLSASKLAEALWARLSYAQQVTLNEMAPERIEVPSGNHHRIDYGNFEAPVLAVKLQELFGLQHTPAIAGGRLYLTVHLLSPAGRPMQVTQDLASFWRNTYPEVRKDLRGRYPKHPWPEDPLSATATARTKRHRKSLPQDAAECSEAHRGKACGRHH